MSQFKKNLADHQLLFNSMDSLESAVEGVANLVTDAFSMGNKLMICGNGGSAADSQHIAAEMVGRFTKNRKPLPAIALSTDTSTLTCIANDYSYDEVFSRQVEALGKPGDIFLGISTSGNSKNVIRAMSLARDMGITVVALTGCAGGQMNSIAHMSITVPSDVTARIQEAHIFIGHTLCGDIESKLGLIN